MLNDYKSKDGEIYYSVYQYKKLCSFRKKLDDIKGITSKEQRKIDRRYKRGFRKWKRNALGIPKDLGSGF